MSGHSSAKIARTGDNAFLKAVATISTISGWCASGMIVAAVAITCQMIFVRFVLNQSTVWQTEAVIYLVIGATLIGLPYVQRLRGHVNVDLIPLALTMERRKLLAIGMLSLSIALVAVMLWYGFEFWHFAWDRGWKSESVWAIQLWIPYLSIPVGFALLLLQLIADLVALILNIDPPFSIEEEGED
ncbi:MAG: TRAP transporter small permease [Alphaproteobacteria bacterium]